MGRAFGVLTGFVVAAAVCLAGCSEERADQADADVGAGTCEDVSTTAASVTEVEVDGLASPTQIHRPEGRGLRVPAVIDLHGLDSSGPVQAALTGFRELADREGFVVAEPSGPVGSLGVTGWEIRAIDEPDRDDVAAMDRLIDVLIDEHCVDPGRIFVAGYSNGGFLAAEMACATGSRVAAVVAVAGFHAPSPCEHHVPTLVVHGSSDPIVPLGPNGVSLIVDDSTPPSLSDLLASSIEEEVASSAAGAGCADVPESADLALDVVELRYEGCADDAEHRLILVDGGGHTWPGAAPAADEGLLWPTTTSFDATEEAWAFFVEHSSRS